MIREVDIIVKFNSFTYLISEGIKNVFKNKKASMASLVTMICAMIMFGVFFVLGENANHVVEQVSSSQGIEVFIVNDATDEEINKLESDIWSLGDRIATVTFVSKQEALESMKESLGSDSDLLDIYEGDNNIFPASFVVTLSDLSYSSEVEQEIWEMDNVKDITSSDQTIDTLIRIANGVKIAIGVIFIFLIIIAITIISNTIKLSVHARRKEISIMKYVGATNGFIRGPFIIEGILIGIVSSALTLLILGTGYDIIIEKIGNSSVLQVMGIQLLQFSDMLQVITIVFLAFSKYSLLSTAVHQPGTFLQNNDVFLNKLVHILRFRKRDFDNFIEVNFTSIFHLHQFPPGQNPSDFPLGAYISAAFLPAVRDVSGNPDAGRLVPQLVEQIEIPVQALLFLLLQLYPAAGQSAGFRNHLLITGQRRKGCKLSRPVRHGHAHSPHGLRPLPV